MTTHTNQHSRSTQRRWGVVAADQVKDRQAEVQQHQTFIRSFKTTLKNLKANAARQETLRQVVMQRASQVVRLGLAVASIGAAPLVWSAVSLPTLAAPVEFKSNFEDGNYSEWRAGELHTPWALKIVPGIDGNNSKVARFEYRNTDVRQYDTVKADLAGPFVPSGTDQWYAFDYYLPSNFETAQRGPIIFQNHAGLGNGGGPPINIRIESINGVNSLVFGISYTSDGRVDPDTISIRKVIGPAVKGSWQKALLYVRWSPDSNGRIEFYQNGKLLYTRSGVIGYKGGRTYPRIGFYASGVKKSKKTTKYADQSVIYFDNFQMGPTRAAVSSPIKLGGSGSTAQKNTPKPKSQTRSAASPQPKSKEKGNSKNSDSLDDSDLEGSNATTKRSNLLFEDRFNNGNSSGRKRKGAKP